MRYDAYRLPGVKWRWVGIGKSPEPDCWPDYVTLEGVRVKTIRGSGWGRNRAYYECPACGKVVVRLYSWTSASQGGRRAHVTCRRHTPAEVLSRDNAVLAGERARELRRKYRNPLKLQAADALERAAIGSVQNVG